ncbi:DUF368 domain-containing protein [Candidatus Nanosalina sp. VS9-1]|uniref:DUF368 domain-containing protein n=1 Tax=Candidatus Nanosalina sp. VS9-1 TaxID=3388566 RepID=UPI0039DFAB86
MGSGLRQWLEIYLKGLAMGAADAVPGVSGGTIALITGIYERLIQALTGITFSTFEDIFVSLKDFNISEIKEKLIDIDIPFLVVLGAGIATAVVLVLRFMHYAISNFPAVTYGFFSGLIAFSAVILYNEVDISTTRRKITAFAGFLFAFIASGYGATSLSHSPLVLVLSGAVAVSAMILPGISGSLILVILGQYEYISAALSDFLSAALKLLTTGDIQPLIQTSGPIAVFVSGAFIGLFSIVHVVRKSLESYRKATMVFLVSMIVGALRAPVLQLSQHLSSVEASWISVAPEFSVAAISGGLAVVILHSYSSGSENF